MVRLRLLVTGLVALLTLGALTPAAPAQSSRSLREELQEALERLENAEDRELVAGEALAKVERRIKAEEKAFKAVQARLARRARAMYTGGTGGSLFEVILSSDRPDDVLARLSLLEGATRGEADLLLEGRRMRRSLEGIRREAMALRREAAEQRSGVLTHGRELQRLLGLRLSAEDAAADAARERRRAQLARASRGSARLSGRYACPVSGSFAFRDTWGARRSGGRRHKGVDIFAPHGAPAYAVTDGRVIRATWSGNGGLGVYLMGNDGNEYYYAHMASAVVRSGRVSAGQVIARVGATGNAQGGSPHIHFELHPGGGYPINPYPFVARVC